MSSDDQEYYEYITKDGDRWDLIAYEFYGDSAQFESIIVANPDIPIIPVLSSGLKLKIPVIDDDDLITTDLPPWKA